MATRRVIPDAYNEYEDGHLGVVPASLANVEIKIGPALGGQPYKFYTLSGADAKKQAKTIFKGGELLRAIEAAFDAGSTRIYACRIGTAVRATQTLKTHNGTDVLRIKGDYGSSGNNHFSNVTLTFDDITSSHAAVYGSPNRVVFYDEDMEEIESIPLPSSIAVPVAIEVPTLPKTTPSDDIFDFFVLGYGTAPGSDPKIWHLNASGEIISTDTLDLAGLVPDGDTLTGLGGHFFGINDDFYVTTDKHLLVIDASDLSSPSLDVTLDFTSFGVESPDVSSTTISFDLAAVLRGEDPERLTLLLDRETKTVVALAGSLQGSPSVKGMVNLSGWVGGDSPEGLAYDWQSGELLVAVRNDGSYPYSRLLRFNVDWDDPSNASYEGMQELDTNVFGLASFMAEAVVQTAVTIQDRNLSPVTTRRYEATSTMSTMVSAIAAKIQAGGVYDTEILQSGTTQCLLPTLEDGDGSPDPTTFEAFTGGSDGGDPTNGDYLAGLEASKAKTDASWIHAVGATSHALWTAILLHCSEMGEDLQAERFAILETPAFDCEYDEGSAEYLADLQDYVDELVERMGEVGDRNACVFAGGATFMDSDGNEIDLPVTAACGGTMAGLEVQKSLINKPVDGVLKLVPEFPPGHIETLIQARVNCIRFKPGRGYILAHSLTAAAEGSDYSRVNDLRAVYYGAKAAREAAQPYVGEENDAAGEGLRRLESAMARPLEQMRDGGQIDAFDLNAVSTTENRLLGDVYVSLGIQPRRAMEMIYTTIYLQ